MDGDPHPARFKQVLKYPFLSVRVSEGGMVWLADPAWGNRKLTAYQFKEMWGLDERGKGKILLIVPEDRQRWGQVNSEFFSQPTVNSSMLELVSRAPLPQVEPPSWDFDLPDDWDFDLLDDPDF